MKTHRTFSRREALKAVGAFGTGMLTTRIAAGSPQQIARRLAVPARPAVARRQISWKMQSTAFIDTHEHLPDESVRIEWKRSSMLPCDDWALLLSHYLNSDLASAGMPKKAMDEFFSPGVDAEKKWDLLEPYWGAVKNTGYGQAVRTAMRMLYDVQDLSAATTVKIQAGYKQLRQPGFYEKVLKEHAGIDTCQVNSLTGEPFKETAMPGLLMQDLSIVGMFSGPGISSFGAPTGIEVKDLSDWHRVLDWWFDHYASYAVSVKSQNAYSRDIDYARVPPETAAPVFQKVLNRAPVTSEERKLLEDHLFWRAVDKATAAGLPVKLHTGYYAGHNGMPLSRLKHNAGSAAELCRLSPDTKFVFMHICYPHYEELLSLVKHYSNAHVDMCWAWIINPIAAKDYFKKHIVTAPANKLLTFGGDYIPVEPVVGHAAMARRGIEAALCELVDEGWLSNNDALELIEPLMNGNARTLFKVEKKLAALKTAPWVK